MQATYKRVISFSLLCPFEVKAILRESRALTVEPQKNAIKETKT